MEELCGENTVVSTPLMANGDDGKQGTGNFPPEATATRLLFRRTQIVMKLNHFHSPRLNNYVLSLLPSFSTFQG